MADDAPTPTATSEGSQNICAVDVESALRESERRFRQLVEHMLEGVVVIQNDRLAFVNPHIATITGYSREELTGRHILSAVCPEDRDRLVAIHKGRIEGGLAPEEYEFSIITKDGRTRLLTARTVRICWNGAPAALSCLRDVTEADLARKKLQDAFAEISSKARELAEANERLKQLEAAKSSFLSGVSHELRTPLTAILGFAKLIRREFEALFLPLAVGDATLLRRGERLGRNLEVIADEGARLARMVGDVLDLTRIEDGRMSWNDVEVELGEVVRTALAEVEDDLAARPSVTLTVDLAPDLPRLRVDPARLAQVLSNLLHNAAKFTRAGQVRLTAAAEPGKGLFVSVADTGPGIPEEYVRHIFDKFQQGRLGDTIQDKPKGTGLGLAICRAIVAHYGGSLKVESLPGHGSTFYVELPARVLACD